MNILKNIIDFCRNERQVFLFLTIQTCFFILIFLSNFIKNSVWKSIVLSLVIFFCIFSLYLLFRLLHYLDLSSEAQIQKMLLSEQINYQNEHLLSIMQSEKDLIQIRKELQFAMEKYRVKTEDESIKITDDFLQNYKDKILINYCANKVIDAVLYNKSLLMKKLHIDYSIVASIEENVGIRDNLMMAVLVNMLDNAIEACDKVPLKQRKILVNLYRKSNYIIFRVENSISDTANNFELGKSTKKNKRNHGVGLQVIHSICREYNGNYRIKVNTKEKMVACIAIMMIPRWNINE